MKILVPIAMLGLCSVSFGASVSTAVTNLEAVGDVTVTGGTAQSTTTVSSNISSNQGVVGSSTASGENLAKSVPDMNPENFLFTSIEEAAASVRRSNSRGRPVGGRSSASHVISFEVGLNEQLDLTFDMVTTLEQSKLTSEITWSLIGPNGAVIEMSGSVTAPGESVSIPQQTATLTEEGSYTFVVTASANPANAALKNSKDFATATIESLSFSGISSIPEPEGPLLLAMSMLGLFSIRRRTAT